MYALTPAHARSIVVVALLLFHRLKAMSTSTCPHTGSLTRKFEVFEPHACNGVSDPAAGTPLPSSPVAHCESSSCSMYREKKAAVSKSNNSLSLATAASPVQPLRSPLPAAPAGMDMSALASVHHELLYTRCAKLLASAQWEADRPKRMVAASATAERRLMPTSEPAVSEGGGCDSQSNALACCCCCLRRRRQRRQR